MQLDRTTPSRPPRTFHLLGGRCLALLYLLTVTPFTLALTALLATSDPSHHVAIQQAAIGLQLVLRHDCVNLGTHRHGMIARTLTLFAQRTTTSSPWDHVIQFGAVDTMQQTSEPIIAPAPEWQLLAAFVPCGPVLRTPAMTFALENLPRPPPVTSRLLLSLRSTVLVV
jgi:hypothetical protein